MSGLVLQVGTSRTVRGFVHLHQIASGCTNQPAFSRQTNHLDIFRSVGILVDMSASATRDEVA